MLGRKCIMKVYLNTRKKMSFDKDYPNRKDKLKPYHKSKRFDRTCRTGGDCPWCIGNRTYKRKLVEDMAFGHVREYKDAIKEG